jgi:hypothetical protein
MIERFFFDWIDIYSQGFTIGEEYKFSIDILAYSADSGLIFWYFTIMIACCALDNSVFVGFEKDAFVRH